jgi:hypothetical protein
MNAELREAVERVSRSLHANYMPSAGVHVDLETIRQALRDQEAEIARLKKDRNCRHMYGADGDGSSCYLCGKANPRHAY